MKEHKKMSSHPLQRGRGMPEFREGHWEKSMQELPVSDLKYTKGEMSNPEHLEASVKGLTNFVKKHEMKN